MAELEAGNTIRARELIEESIALADLMEFTQGRAEKRVLLARILTWQGELDDARAAILESRSIWEKSGDTFTLVLTLAAAAQVAVAAGDTAGAVEQVTELRRLLHEGSLPPWTHFEGDELEALVGVGRTDEAKKRLLELDQRNRDHPSVRRGLWAARGGALILASEGDLAGALSHLEGALDSPRLDLTLVPLEHARTLLLKGRLERRTKHKAAASRTLEEAASLFDLLGARAWAERAQEEASRLGLRRPRQELTVTERRIAELAATGKTNQGIASELFISRRTVESNIARVYRKLNIRNRVELSNIVSTWTHGPLG
jgi:DNA-binding CsgD family transcriptional regulator